MNVPPSEGPATLDTLLVTGPFPDALRAAIRARGLSLERVQAKLAAAGAHVSLAALSYWQSGRSQPEREASVAALTILEEILGLHPKALTALLPPPRPRGRKAGAVDLVAIYHDKGAVIEALREFDTVWGDTVVGISQHDRVVVGADGFLHSQWNRRVLRATVDGPDRLVLVYSADGGNTPEIVPLHGCALGHVVVDHDAGIIVADLLFGRTLKAGEFAVVEHRIDMTAPFADTQSVRRLPQPLREYVIEVEFAKSHPPERCVQITSPALDSDEHFTERLVTVDENGRALAVGVDVAPCQFGIRWEWAGARSREQHGGSAPLGADPRP